jgi:peptidyl-prolyl cis-trans isomerase C
MTVDREKLTAPEAWGMPLRRMRSIPWRLLAFATLFALAACGSRQNDTATESAPAKKAETGGEVIATYRGRKLTSDAVVQEFERLPAPSRSYLTAPDRKRQFVENLVMNDLLYEEGQKAGYDKEPDIERQVNDMRKRLVVQRVMRQYQNPPNVTDEQVRAYYDQNPTIYSTTQIHASHILLKDEATARQVLADVKANPDKFADIAREKSTDTISAKKGGDLGTFGPGRMVPEFEKAAFALKPGEISDVVKTQYGFHIIMVTERKEGDPKPFDSVKEQIRATLRNRGLQDQVQNHFDQLKKDADLKIDDDALARLTPPGPTPGQQPPVSSGH